MGLRQWLQYLVYRPEFIQFFDLCLHIFGVPHNH